ncbi:MAG: PAS domain-containing sensor histidine kinase [Bacteroidetes bacterium]|nr:PAS domain-containing sensor histidine kinase [Bacteroidota bacterium]
MGEKYRILFESSRDAIMLLAPPDWLFTIGNKATLEMFGAKNEKEFYSKTPADLSPEYQPDGQLSSEKAGKVIGKAMRNGSFFFEWTHKRINGEEFPANVLLTRIELDGRKILTATVRDITRIKKTEKELQRYRDHLEKIVEERTIKLQKSEEKYRSFFKTSKDCIFITSKEGEWLDMSDSAPEFFGYENKEKLEKVKIDDLYENPADREEYARQVEKQGFAKEFAVNLQKKDGTVINVLITSILIKDDKGEMIALQGSIRDITVQKETENALKKSREHLQELNTTKNKFFSLLGHDLRSPFNSIIGFSELLYNETVAFSKAEIKEMAKSIYITSQETYNLLNNLLEWSGTQTGRIKFDPAKTGIYDSVLSTVDLLSDTAKKKNISILIDIPEQIQVFADLNMISTVIRNLLSNAIKFTPEKGSIKISAEDTGKFVEVTVADTGVGINPEDINKLFRIDADISTPGTANEKGTGLGLILCKEFIIMNNGDIRVESEIGKGSRFIVTLPKKKEKEG